MTSTRFLTGGLATLAVASAVTLSGPGAFAADAPGQPCGTPAIPAVFTTVTHDPQYRTTPAVTHSEWRWERTVTTLEYEFSRVIPSATTVDWSRVVIDQVAVPEVPGTPEIGHFVTVVVTPAVTEALAEYQQQQTGKLRWESPDWGAQNGQGSGWEKTGNTRDVITTPAQTTQQWFVDQAAIPGTPGTPEVTRTEYRTTSGSAPDGTGWIQGAVHTVPGSVDTVWAFDAPSGYTATGNSRVHDVATQETATTSPTPPAGDGWSKVAGSETVVTDTPALTELVTPGFIEQVLVSPEVPGTDPCVSAPDPAVMPPVVESSSAAAGPLAHVTVSAVKHHAAAAAAAPGEAVLASTGNPASIWLTATAFGALLAGGALVRVARRRPSA